MQDGLPSPYFAAGGRYVMNNESFGRMMLESRRLAFAVRYISTKVKHQAKRNTERSHDTNRRRVSGRKLADSYEVETGPPVTIVVNGRPAPRLSMRVVNRQRYAAAREFGRGGRSNGFTKGTRDLRRAGMVFGDLAGEPR